MRVKRHSKQKLVRPSASTIAVLVACFALVVSISQATIAWYVMNRPLESTLLQQQILQCSSIISLIQDFGNRNAEYRVLAAIRAGRSPASVPGVSYETKTTDHVSDEEFKTKFRASLDAAYKAMDFLNTVHHVYDPAMKLEITTASSLMLDMLDAASAVDGVKAIQLAKTLRNIMSRCDSYGGKYGL